jgi:hypothetical protein
MKTKIIFIAALIGTGMLSSSCSEDFLDQENTTSLNQNSFFESDKAVSEATATLYNYVWNSFNGKLYYSMGDGRSNNITAQWSNYIKVYTNFNETSLSEGLQEGWASLYSVVAQSNNTINNIKEKSTSAVSESAKTQGIAEARFMRGLAYWYLASLWGNVIIYENTSSMVNNYVVPTNPRADAMEFAIRDMEYAAKYLPSVSSAAGRVNKYSAYGMLSRFYLSMAGITTDGQYDGKNVATDFNRGTRNTYYLDLARKAAEKVISASSFKLMGSYGDLFKIANNNCSEDMFQLQWLAGSTDAIGWGCNQDITAFFGWSTMVSDGTNWGGATCCSWNLFQEYESGDLRKHENIAAYGDYYADINVKGGGYTYGVTESASTNGANIKKYVVGTHDDNGVSYKQSSGINTHMLRMAEVYLNLAEAILGNNPSTTDAEALNAFNAIRTRAGLEAKSSIAYEDLRHERRMEFAFEGLYWYDLVNRAYYKQQEVVNYLNNQDRNRSYKYDSDKSAYVASENAGTGVATATASSMLLPYSDADQNKNKYLKTSATPAAYSFSAREVDESSLFE